MSTDAFVFILGVHATALVVLVVVLILQRQISLRKCRSARPETELKINGPIRNPCQRRSNHNGGAA